MPVKRLLILFAALIALHTTYGQAEYEPQILILAPNKMTYDKELEQEISTYNKQIKDAQKNGEVRPSFGDTTGQPANVRMMIANEQTVIQSLNFSNTPSYVALQHLAYMFFDRFPELLILVSQTKSSEKIADLKKIARKHKMQYVLNFPKVAFYKEDGMSKADISVQLYDQKTDAILLYKTFTGDWRNPGFQFTCPDSSLFCAISNALAPALYGLMEIVMVSSDKFQEEVELSEKQERLSDIRRDVLAKDYYNLPWDSALIAKAISPADTHINGKALHHGLVDETKTKFIAFYFETEQEPRNMYYVTGAKYNGEWYYRKSEVMYYGGGDTELVKLGQFKDLAEWGFFKEGTLEYNPDFWETGLFEKVKDITKDADWEKYKQMWATEEHENRPYVGMYEIVAGELKKRAKVANERFDSLMGNTVFLPFYERQIKTNPSFVQYTLWGKKPLLIFPSHRKYVLNPVAVTDSEGQKNLHFYFAFAGSKTVYEWTYLQPVPIKQYSGDIIDQLGTITKWNFSYTTLNDDRFWEDYVLKKSGNEYIYLKHVQ